MNPPLCTPFFLGGGGISNLPPFLSPGHPHQHGALPSWAPPGRHSPQQPPLLRAAPPRHPKPRGAPGGGHRCPPRAGRGLRGAVGAPHTPGVLGGGGGCPPPGAVPNKGVGAALGLWLLWGGPPSRVGGSGHPAGGGRGLSVSGRGLNVWGRGLKRVFPPEGVVSMEGRGLKGVCVQVGRAEGAWPQGGRAGGVASSKWCRGRRRGHA